LRFSQAYDDHQLPSLIVSDNNSFLSQKMRRVALSINLSQEDIVFTICTCVTYL
jgi:hypothetical protein